MCRPTQDFLLKRLRQDGTYPTLSQLELNFSPLQLGTKLPEQPRFHVYWEVGHATAHFETTVDTIRTPSGPDFFDQMGKHFDSSYCLEVVRGTDTDTSPLATAIEVQVRRLTRPTDGGAVVLPPFYIGFVCEDPPCRRLNDEEIKLLTAHAREEAIQHLSRAYPTVKNEFLRLDDFHHQDGNWESSGTTGGQI